MSSAIREETLGHGQWHVAFRANSLKEDFVRHGNMQLRKVFRALDAINGEAGADAITAGREFEPIPEMFGDDTLGQVGALYQKLDRQIIEALRRGEVEVVLESPTKLLVRQKEQLVVDSNGRFIFRGLENFAVDANWAYRLDRELRQSYAETLDRIEHAFQRNGFISAARFEDLAEAKKQATLVGPYANLFKGVYARPFAVAIPPVNIVGGRLGEALGEIFVPAAERGYHREFPERAFNNYLENALAGQVESFPESRQDKLIAALCENPVVLWVFMNCLQGGSINACRQLIIRQPEELMLGGTIANAAVIASYPQIAAKDASTPLYYSAADAWQPSCSLYFGPGGADLRFFRWRDLGHRDGGCSASVAVRA